jgi:hypothetical protein
VKYAVEMASGGMIIQITFHIDQSRHSEFVKGDTHTDTKTHTSS